MRRVIVIVLLLSFFVSGWAQKVDEIVGDNNLAVWDSIENRHYPGMFEKSQKWGVRLIPTFGYQKVSELKTFYTPYDSIKYVIRVSHDYSREYVRRAKIGKGWMTVYLKDFTNAPIDSCELHSFEKTLKRVKKNYKVKLVGYIRCDTPMYPKQEIKRITLYVSYSPYGSGDMGTEMWVDHLPYSTDNKYGGPCTPEGWAKHNREQTKLAAEVRAQGERNEIIRRYKDQHPSRPPRITRRIRKKMAELEQAARNSPGQMEEGKKARKKESM